MAEHCLAIRRTALNRSLRVFSVLVFAQLLLSLGFRSNEKPLWNPFIGSRVQQKLAARLPSVANFSAILISVR